MKKIFEQLKERKWIVMLFVCILLVGIFLRTYEFHDFLRFNADQSRDATVVSEYLQGKSDIPLLGPKAGGTTFRVGPMFYHFQIIAAKLFGDAPDFMAYPDLLSSILAIPLLYFFLRKYFDVRTALLLTAIFAVSLYAVKYSRFAWNPNSLPFWSMLFLYTLHEIATAKGEAKKFWSVLAGIALGVGVQLHTMSLLFFPVMTMAMFVFLFFESRTQRAESVVGVSMQWKSLFIMVALALFLNTGQIVSEVRSGGENTAAFFGGAETKEAKGNGIILNTLKNVVCYTEANVYVLSSYDSDDGCSIRSIVKGWNIPVFFGGLAFFLGGLFLALRAFQREIDLSKKYFLGIVFFYLSLSFLILLPLANEVSMRFFLAMIFMPFVLLGLWFEYVQERYPKYAAPIMITLTLFFVITNLASLHKTFVTSQSYLSDSNAGMDNVMLREVELASSFIISHAGDAPVVAVDGDVQFLFKALKSMNYFTSREGIKLVQKTKKTDPTLPLFLIENTRQTEKILADRDTVSDHLTFGRFTIFSLRSK